MSADEILGMVKRSSRETMLIVMIAVIMSALAGANDNMTVMIFVLGAGIMLMLQRVVNVLYVIFAILVKNSND